MPLVRTTRRAPPRGARRIRARSPRWAPPAARRSGPRTRRRRAAAGRAPRTRERAACRPRAPPRGAGGRTASPRSRPRRSPKPSAAAGARPARCERSCTREVSLVSATGVRPVKSPSKLPAIRQRVGMGGARRSAWPRAHAHSGSHPTGGRVNCWLSHSSPYWNEYRRCRSGRGNASSSGGRWRSSSAGARRIGAARGGEEVDQREGEGGRQHAGRGAARDASGERSRGNERPGRRRARRRNASARGRPPRCDGARDGPRAAASLGAAAAPPSAAAASSAMSDHEQRSSTAAGGRSTRGEARRSPPPTAGTGKASPGR